jgi:hypothetical protein
MRNSVLDTTRLLGYRLLSEEEIFGEAVTSLKIGGKIGEKAGGKPPADVPAS